jgi:hypothetical protein
MPRLAPPLSYSIGLLCLFAGCADESQPAAPLPAGAMSGPPPMEKLKPAPEIKRIMVKIGKGPKALSVVLGNELGGTDPVWPTVQSHTKEFAQLAKELAQYDPPRGRDDSWIELTRSYADKAAEMDRAAQVKDQEKALAAHEQLANGCMSCHRQHRPMGRRG